MKFDSETLVEFIAKTGGIFTSRIIEKVFHFTDFRRYLLRKSAFEIVAKRACSFYIYKLPDQYISQYFNVRWKREKALNSRGELEFRKRVVKYLKDHNLKGRFSAYSNEFFYKKIYREMFTEDAESRFWIYAYSGLNESYIIQSLALLLLMLTERIRPYTKEMLVENFPEIYQKFSGKGMFFSIVEDDLGRDKNACILLENLKSHESIIKMIQRFGADEFIKDRCYFYIISGNKNSLEILEKRIKTYRRKIIGADGVFVKYEENPFRGIRIFYRYFPELAEVINRG